MTDEAPTPTDEDVLRLLRAAAARGLSVSRRETQNNLLHFGFDIEGVSDLIAECHDDELHDHELDHLFPERNDYVVELRIELDDHPAPFYVKVALKLPEMTSGRLLSFKYWS